MSPKKHRRKPSAATVARRKEQDSVMSARGFITIAEAAKRAAVAERTVHGWVQREVIAYELVYGRHYVSAASVTRHIAAVGLAGPT